MVESLTDFNAITIGSWCLGLHSSNQLQLALSRKERQIRLINTSMLAANVILKQNNVPEVPLLRFAIRYPIGTPVSCRMGLGIVHSFRSGDGIYEVLLHFSADGKARARGYFIGEALTLVTTRGPKNLLLSIAPVAYRDPKTRAKSVTTLSSSSHASNPLMNALLWTPYGIALFVSHRVKDDVIIASSVEKNVVKRTFYLQRKQVVQITNGSQ